MIDHGLVSRALTNPSRRRHILHCINSYSCQFPSKPPVVPNFLHRSTTINTSSSTQSFPQTAHRHLRLSSSIPQRDDNICDVIRSDIEASFALPSISIDSNSNHAQLREERRQIHVENNAKKQARQKIHQENYGKGQTIKMIARRRILAEEWMRVFASSPDLFRATLRELKVDKGKCPGDDITSIDPSLLEYQQFYLDSLPSFGTLMVEGDDSEDDLVTQSLDKFGESVFADPVFAKSYREMRTRLKRKDDLLTTHSKVMETHAHAVRNHLQLQESNLREVESTVDQSRISDPDKSYCDDLDQIETSFQLLNQSSPKQISNEHKQKIDRAKKVVERMEKRIEWLLAEIDEISMPLSMKEFEAANSQLMALSSDIIPALANYITNRHSDFEKYRQLEQHTDLTKPHEWYPRARLDKRKIIFHAGPTNSGKTYNALLRLKQAKKGMYLAPLRLLAAECYENLTSDGIYTSLITGQEHRNVPFCTHKSSTVELACLEEDYDVVVIDEIQMLCDFFRGFAWTRALMGVRCKEVHVCGGAEAHDIVKKIAKMCGDDFEVKTYTRFGELRVLEHSLSATSTERGSYSKVQEGDCIVAFSRQDIFAIKREIENTTSFKCCVIYGTLPPEIRTEQSRLFNDPNSEYKILVASDAIGMGLNLSIKRIIFNSMFKNNGEKIVQLDHSLVKQIAGRAGRRNSPFPNGEVTCRDPQDMIHLRKCMGTEIRPIKKAGLIPTPTHIGMFNDLLGDYGMSHKNDLGKTLSKFSEMATLQGDFFLCKKKSMEIVSRWLNNVDMSSTEKFAMCMSPVNDSCEKSKRVLMRYVEKYSIGKVPGVHRSMLPRKPTSFQNLADLCSVHQQLELFLWLQKRFPSNAVEYVRAMSMKEEATAKINEGLYNADKLSLNKYDYVSKDLRVKKTWNNESSESGLNVNFDRSKKT